MKRITSSQNSYIKLLISLKEKAKVRQREGLFLIEGKKELSLAFQGGYEIKKIFIDKESLDERGLSLSDLQELVWEDEDEDYAEKSSINLVSRAELSEIMNQQDVVLSF